MERGWGAAIANRAGAVCPPASQLVDFADRGEAADCFGPVVAHLAQCEACRQIVMEMRQAEAAMAARRRAFPRVLRPMTVLSAMMAVLAVGSVLVVSHLRASHSPAEGRVAINHGPVRPGGRASGPRIEENPPPALADVGPHPHVEMGRGEAVGKLPAGSPASVVGAPNDSDDPSLPPTSQQYCLVGSDGVFSMPSPNFHRKEREQIEKQYADQVKAARDAYVARAANPVSTGTATAELNRSLVAAGAERERALSTLYVKQRSSPTEALNLKLDGEAPYQVVEVHYRAYRHELRPVKLVVHSPWPGYHPYRKPYGWDYDVAYDPDQFRSKYAEWRKGYVEQGRPAFCGLEGHAGPIVLPNIVGSRDEGYADRRAPGSGPAPDQYTHEPQAGYTHGQPSGGTFGSPPSPGGYTHSSAASPPQPGAQSPAAGGYTHSGAQAPASGGYTHQTPSPGGYAHSRGNGGDQNSGAGYTHAAKGSGASSTYTHHRRDGRQNEKDGS